MNTDPLAAWSALVTLYQAVLHDVVGRLGDEAGMDSGVFSALAYLERAEPSHRMRLSELQRHMSPRYSQPGLSRLVQRMEADGLVARAARSRRRPRRDPRDHTRRSDAPTRRANRSYEAAVTEHFGRHLGAHDGARIEAVVTRVLAARATGTT